MLSLLFREINLMLGWDSERESCFVVFVGDGQVAITNNIHADNYIVLVGIKFHSHYVRYNVACWQANMH